MVLNILFTTFGVMFVRYAIAATDMGPSAFMWPPDRTWSAAMDNTPPCGSSASPGNRTGFPLKNGKVALVAQDESYSIHLSISYDNNPDGLEDFDLLLGPSDLSELDLGHTCVTIPDPPGPVTAGSNATLQLLYVADFDKPGNQSFYACADIRYVADFAASVPCFNATEGNDGAVSTGGHGGSDATASGAAASATAEAGEGRGQGQTTSSSSVPSSLSRGAVVGAVVGSVVGAALVAGLALWGYRRGKQNRRLQRQLGSRRGVKWDEQERGKDSASQPSIRLQNLAGE